MFSDNETPVLAQPARGYPQRQIKGIQFVMRRVADITARGSLYLKTHGRRLSLFIGQLHWRYANVQRVTGWIDVRFSVRNVWYSNAHCDCVQYADRSG